MMRGVRAEPTAEQIVAGRLWRGMGLKDAEYEMVVRELGRHPNWTELGMFAVLWSEHCAYKHSKSMLRTLPTKGPRVLVGPGENAGVVDIGDGLAVAFKMESHNHPCAVEPYQGAATGVGGIIRDILAMGARPIALMDPLRFGDLTDPRVRYLFSGVVSGIAGYGNCVGIPTVGGEVVFEGSCADNPLCNVMCVGLIRVEDIKRGIAAGVGNSVMLVGHSTGRDGIHGCTFASEELGEDTEEKRPNVQVGDPFVEKLLIEACLEMIETGAVVGIQDMGAAGITSSCAETAARAGTGIEIDVDLVPLREEDMTPYEIMLSESQERMLLIVDRGREAEVEAICEKWGLRSAVIGRVTADGLFRVRKGGEVVAEIPAASLAERAPVYEPAWAEPGYLGEARAFDAASLPVPDHMGAALKKVLASPTIACKEWVYRQYDHMIGTNTIVLPGADAAVLRIKGMRRAIALSTDGNGRYCYLDPFVGGAIAVAEAARNVVCAGAKPIAITDCLNFANPEKPEIYWQFMRAVEGMKAACEALGTPVTGGNVSFYNETSGRPIYPTPIVGMLGLIEDADRFLTPRFKSPGDVVIVIGRTMPELGGSEYLKTVHGRVAGRPPAIDLDLERRVQDVVLRANALGILRSAHDVSDGGIAVALAECCFGTGTGVEVRLEWDDRPDAALFSESQSRILITVRPEDVATAAGVCEERGVPFSVIGRVTDDGRLVIRASDVCIDERVAELEEVWRGVIPCAMK